MGKIVMFAVIYRGYLKEGCELKYQDAWHKIATYFKFSRGALGSCLHKAEDGMWLAYSRWPDKETRDKSWPGDEAPANELPNEIKEAIVIIQESIDQSKKMPEICLEVIDDLI